jgi:hypothetical protein
MCLDESVYGILKRGFVLRRKTRALLRKRVAKGAVIRSRDESVFAGAVWFPAARRKNRVLSYLDVVTDEAICNPDARCGVLRKRDVR